MQQNENDDPLQNQNNQQTVLQQEQQEQQDENGKKTQAAQEQSNGDENQNEQFNNASENTNNQQQELNKEKTTIDTDQQGETLDALNEKEQQQEKQVQSESQQENKGNQQNSINDQTIENSQDAQLSNNKEVKQEKEIIQSNRANQQEQGQFKEQKQQKEDNIENQGQRNNQKKKTTKRRTTKVEVQENQQSNNPSQSNNDANQENQETDQNNQEKAELEAKQKQIEEQQKQEELLKKQEQEQQEKLHKQQLRDKFFKSMIFPLRTQNKKGKQFNLTFEIESEKLQVKMRGCKSAQRYQKEKKPRTKSAINKELFDFFNTMNPKKHIEAMTPNTLQKRKKQQELDQMRKDCERLEEQHNQQQITQPLPQKEQRSSIHYKQRTSSPKKKLEVYVRKRKKVKREDVNRQKQGFLIESLRFHQKNVIEQKLAAELKRQEKLEKLSVKISSQLEHLRLGNQRYKEEQQKQKRKQALEQIAKQEQKRYEMMLEQQKNERFVRELKEKAGVSSYYSAKKLALGSPTSLVKELENGQIKIEQNIDTNRKLNENQFLLKDEQKKGIKDNKSKQQDYNKQVSLLNFPKINDKKHFELVNQYISAENKEALPEIKPKRKKAWQIEQELKQRRYKNSDQFKE
ncbi:unnamed protein product (macronuclear) [Paramecium tetraurelia]|uniref:Uncharacterized protein n=1 Tax=Paramecium tetraurelia TaxID=5888 RepID=A0BRV8_PARTE|nr:uncharacterized protein GSPATT00031506001 [Paramecium tetraurelia]CAK61275.1 unnamed protein product [Paramecium tetraurelia]|eukprot:XP_001428673.1 hypothetical protein (macronuclear) [Paramecium tetraurelia strain d4-2]